MLVGVFDAVTHDVDALSNSITGLQGYFDAWKTTTYLKITNLQEFKIVFYNDVTHLHDEIDVVAVISPRNTNSITTLSNSLVCDSRKTSTHSQ